MPDIKIIRDAAGTRGFACKLKDYYSLTKPEVNLLVLMATSTGYYLGSSGTFRFLGLVNTLIGTLLVASGTATLNQWMERNWDGKMRRTASRPIPSGRLTASSACLFGAMLSVAGGLFLASFVNGLAAFIAIFAQAAYLLVYTPLKRKTALCTLVGAVPGAMPTLIGWAGAAGKLTEGAWLLFAVLFLWQFPHFLAIALTFNEDYTRAGYKMLPDFDVSFKFTRTEVLILTAVLVVITMLPPAGPATLRYFTGVCLAGAYFLYHAIRLCEAGSRQSARRLTLASVLYLPVVLAMMAASKVGL